MDNEKADRMPSNTANARPRFFRRRLVLANLIVCGFLGWQLYNAFPAFASLFGWNNAPTTTLTGERALVPLEASIMSKCPDARDCLRDLVLPTMQRVMEKVNFTLSFIGT
jgi:hypothetical protein